MILPKKKGIQKLNGIGLESLLRNEAQSTGRPIDNRPQDSIQPHKTE
jgi:hypothetical protein